MIVLTSVTLLLLLCVLPVQAQYGTVNKSAGCPNLAFKQIIHGHLHNEFLSREGDRVNLYPLPSSSVSQYFIDGEKKVSEADFYEAATEKFAVMIFGSKVIPRDVLNQVVMPEFQALDRGAFHYYCHYTLNPAPLLLRATVEVSLVHTMDITKPVFESKP